MKYKIQKEKLFRFILHSLLGKDVYYGELCNSMNLDNVPLSNYQPNSKKTCVIIKEIFSRNDIFSKNTDPYKHCILDYSINKNLDYFYYLYELYDGPGVEKINNYKSRDKNKNIIWNETLMKILFIYLNNTNRDLLLGYSDENFFDSITIQDLYNLIVINIFARELDHVFPNDEMAQNQAKEIHNYWKNNLYKNTKTYANLSPEINVICDEAIYQEFDNILTEPILYLASKFHIHNYVTVLNKEIFHDAHPELIHELWKPSKLYSYDYIEKKIIKTKVLIAMYKDNSKYETLEMLEESFIFLLRHKILIPEFN